MRTRDELWDWVWEEGWADPELEADFQAAASSGVDDLDLDLWEDFADAGEALAATPLTTEATVPSTRAGTAAPTRSPPAGPAIAPPAPDVIPPPARPAEG